jgi:hypothetical protein
MTDLLIERWIHHMSQGEFEAAWLINDEILNSRNGASCAHLPRHLQYVWDGTPLNSKRVLVRCYHGLGDTIQFIRYVRLLSEIGSKVIVWAQPPLLQILTSLEGIDQLLPLHDGEPEVEYDVDIEVMELPYAFRTSLKTIPTLVPYLNVPPARLSRLRGLAVGLVWEGGEWNRRRSIPTELLAPLLEIDDISWHVLQRGPVSSTWPTAFRTSCGPESLLELASVMRSLDLVISIDSMPAHLAGACGVPIWNLLPFEADWRWMKNRTDSPWYPTMRLFRQHKRNDWRTVINQVVGELRKVIGGKFKVRR